MKCSLYYTKPGESIINWGVTNEEPAEVLKVKRAIEMIKQGHGLNYTACKVDIPTRTLKRRMIEAGFTEWNSKPGKHKD